LPDSLPPHISAPSCRRPSAKRRRLGGLRRTTPRSRRTLLEARRRARQSIREYELIWLLQQRLRAVSWPHWRLRCMQPLLGHGMGVLRPSSLSRGDPSACHARFMCSAPAFSAWRRLPLICLRLLVGVCVRDGLGASPPGSTLCRCCAHHVQHHLWRRC